MPAHYIHIAAKDVREQLLRDAGLDANGYRTVTEAGGEERVLAELLQRILAKKSGNDLTTRPTLDNREGKKP
ncbi:MAG: hypothetical protein AABX89_02280 [Candidatus Thermoplasmatota archaeon]